MMTSSSRVNASKPSTGRGRRLDEAEGAEDARRLGPRLGGLVLGVGVADQGRPGGDLEVAVEVDVGGTDQDRRVGALLAVGVASDQRGDGRVVAAALGLVLLDQPAGVLDRAASDGRGEHRVAQNLADVAVRATGEQVLGVHQVGHRLEVRAEHQAALVADVAHHLELFVDDHEELVDLLLVLEELQQLALLVGVRLQPAHAERPADRVHPHLAGLEADVPLGRRADQVAVTGEDQERPERSALALQQPAEHRQRGVVAPVGDLGPVVPTDHQVGALALADLVVDDLPDDAGVVLVGRLETAAVGELDRHVGQRREHLGDRQLGAVGDLDRGQRRAVLVRLEPAFARLRVRHQHQLVPGLLGAGLQRDVGEHVEIRARPTDQRDGVGLAHADQRERRLSEQLVEGGHLSSFSMSRPATGSGAEGEAVQKQRCPEPAMRRSGQISTGHRYGWRHQERCWTVMAGA